MKKNGAHNQYFFGMTNAGMEETMESNVISNVFGTKVFNDEVMQEYLPKKTYQALKKTIENGEELTPEMANVVAHGMKEWALSNGATHYTHWFQPMTGVTAEKHDSFIFMHPHRSPSRWLGTTGNYFHL